MLWIAAFSGAYDNNCKTITLDDNGKYNGYICLPTGIASLYQPKVCVMTTDEIIEGSGIHGFGYESVGSTDNTANIVIQAFMVRPKKVNDLKTTFETFDQIGTGALDTNNFTSVPQDVGFKYVWKNVTHDYYSGSPSADDFTFTWSRNFNLGDRDNYVMGCIMVVGAGIQAWTNSSVNIYWDP